MTKASPNYRRDPQPGTVIMMTLESGFHAYFFSLDGTWYWLYDFVTDHPTREKEYFDKKHFKLPLILGGRLESDYLDVCHFDLPPGERLAPKTVHVRSKEDALASGEPTRFRVLRRGGGYDYVSEEEASNMYKAMSFSEIGEARNFVNELLSDLRKVQVPLKERWVPAKKVSKAKPAPKPVTFEVHFQCEPEVMDKPADEIAEMLGEDLEINNLGSLMTMDSAGPDSIFEVVLEAEPSRVKSALRQIRATLKYLKAPKDTFILEIHETETIRHAFQQS